MNLIKIAPDTYINLLSVASIKLNGFKPGAPPIIAKNRTLVITFADGHAFEFKAELADSVVSILNAEAGIVLAPE